MQGAGYHPVWSHSDIQPLVLSFLTTSPCPVFCQGLRLQRHVTVLRLTGQAPAEAIPVFIARCPSLRVLLLDWMDETSDRIAGALVSAPLPRAPLTLRLPVRAIRSVADAEVAHTIVRRLHSAGYVDANTLAAGALTLNLWRCFGTSDLTSFLNHCEYLSPEEQQTLWATFGDEASWGGPAALGLAVIPPLQCRSVWFNWIRLYGRLHGKGMGNYLGKGKGKGMGNYLGNGFPPPRPSQVGSRFLLAYLWVYDTSRRVCTIQSDEQRWAFELGLPVESFRDVDLTSLEFTRSSWTTPDSVPATRRRPPPSTPVVPLYTDPQQLYSVMINTEAIRSSCGATAWGPSILQQLVPNDGHHCRWQECYADAMRQYETQALELVFDWQSNIQRVHCSMEERAARTALYNEEDSVWQAAQRSHYADSSRLRPRPAGSESSQHEDHEDCAISDAEWELWDMGSWGSEDSGEG